MSFLRALIVSLVILGASASLLADAPQENDLCSHIDALPVFSRETATQLSKQYEKNALIAATREEKLEMLRSWAATGFTTLRASRFYCNLPPTLKNEFDLLAQRVEEVALEQDECSDSIFKMAYTYIRYKYPGPIVFCDIFFEVPDPRAQLSTFIHELVHTLGYDHGFEHSDRTQILSLLFERVKDERENRRVQSSVVRNKDITGCLLSKRCMNALNSTNLQNTEQLWTKMLTH